MKNFQKRLKVERNRRAQKEQKKEQIKKAELVKNRKKVRYTRQDFEIMAKIAEKHHNNHIKYVAEAEEKIKTSQNMLKVFIFLWLCSGLFFYFKFNIFNIEAAGCSLFLFVSIPLILKHFGHESLELWQGELASNLNFLNKMRENVMNYKEEDYLITT